MKYLYIDKFATSAAFLAALANKKVNPDNAPGGETASHQENQHKTSWTGTENFEEATNLMKYGYQKGLEGIRQEQIKLQRKNKAAVEKPHIITDFAGFAPHVPNYLAGLPTNMINRTKTAKEFKTVRFYIDCLGDCTKDANFFYKAGANILTIIQALERHQINTEVIFLAYYNAGTNKNVDIQAVMQIKAKAAGERLNAIRLSFPLCHPSFTRRLFFDWAEKLPFSIDTSSYGCPADLSELNKVLNLQPNEILISPYLAQEYETLINLVKAINTL